MTRWFVRINRRGIHLVKVERSRAGAGAHIRSLVKWGKR